MTTVHKLLYKLLKDIYKTLVINTCGYFLQNLEIIKTHNKTHLNLTICMQQHVHIEIEQNIYKTAIKYITN